MATKQLKNLVVHKLTVQPLVGDTVFTWDSVSGWPTVGDFIIRLDHPNNGTFEYILCTSVNVGANQTTSTRAQEGTSASGGFIIGSTGANALTEKMLSDGFARLDTALSQTMTGPLVVPTALGGTAAATAYGSMPIKGAENLLGAGAASVTFNNIPATFRHLDASWYARSDTASVSTGISMRFNNISTGTYDYQEVAGSAATATAAELLAQTAVPMSNIPGATATANYFGIGRARVEHYAGTTGNKPVVGQTGFMTADTTGTGNSKAWHGKWRTTATAISRLDFLPGAGNFVTGSLFSLWLVP